MSELSTSIKVGLARVGKRQLWLAGELGFSRSYMSEICNGHKSIKFEKTAQIAALFGVKHSVFVAWGEE